MQMSLFGSLFKLDMLAMIMLSLIISLGIIIIVFASRYLRGDRLYYRFLGLLLLLLTSLCGLVSADNIYCFWVLWVISNRLLVQLMIHKAQWTASRAAGNQINRTAIIGAICLACACGLLANQSGNNSIQHIVQYASLPCIELITALGLILIAAMCQSAIWPCHRWLLSSLNSPTPVSAVMHAGLVNGGGLLLVRFAPLYFSQADLLLILFVLGLISATLGTFWKLMQTDIKRMLACSTMAQMGFMLIQCGLGLFPAAVAHLCWHGLFKSYLFLAAGSAAQEQRLPVFSAPKMLTFGLALLCGIVGSTVFAVLTHKSWFTLDTTLLLLVMVSIAGTQFALIWLQKGVRYLLLACLLTCTASLLYALSVTAIQIMLQPLNLMQPQPLHFLHGVGIVLFVSLWLLWLFSPCMTRINPYVQHLWDWLYVTTLNASQPQPDTVTANRNDYQYR